MLQDMIMVAVNEANKKVDAETEKKMAISATSQVNTADDVIVKIDNYHYLLP